ncbi:hypothetical protein [Litoribacillus peritrichatus]|uniref:Uncharacterized protein n=1 Tax=Litoribacillus peritrichatus TaxID=718191 RepID=A0ABP7N4W6_9GAMM
MEFDWKKLGHWLAQIIPPLLLLGFFSRSGPGFWFLLGIPALCFLISVISLVIKLFNLKKNRSRIVRPGLVLIIFSGLFSAANYSYQVAVEEADEIFHSFNEDCRLNSECPLRPDGWEEVEAHRRYRLQVGGEIKYPLTYTYHGDHFSLYLHQSVDMGKHYEGGNL